jgi:hypothetical protein
MKVTIPIQGQLQTIQFTPAHVTGRTLVREDGMEEHSITLRGVDHWVVAFTRSKEASKRLVRDIRLNRVSELHVDNQCLGLGVLLSPRGWPEREEPATHFIRAADTVVLTAGVHVPVRGESFLAPSVTDGFCIVTRFPDVVYQHIHYSKVRNIWSQDNRVDLCLDPAKMPLGLSNINIVTRTWTSAYQLRTDFKNQQVLAVRVNDMVHAIIQEIKPAFRESRLQVDGLCNLTRFQKRALEYIGVSLMPDGRLLTSPLRWENARMLAAAKLL